MGPVGSWAAIVLLAILCAGMAYGLVTYDKGEYYGDNDKERNIMFTDSSHCTELGYDDVTGEPYGHHFDTNGVCIWCGDQARA